MPNNNYYNEIIAQKFELEHLSYLSREDLQNALSFKIAYLLEYDTEALFSKLYRLDIFESKIKAVMVQDTDIAYQIAGLIIDRQIEKEASRNANPPSTPEEEDLKW